MMTRRGVAKNSPGYFGFVCYGLKKALNIGTLMRSGHVFDAALLGVIGARYSGSHADVTKAYRHVPLLHYKDIDDFLEHRPHDCQLVSVEIVDAARPLETFSHPKRALYIFGPEDGSVPKELLDASQYVVHIPSIYCLNIGCAAAVVAYDRTAKRLKR